MSGAAAAAPRASVLACGLLLTIPFLQPYHRFPLTSFYSEWLALGLGLAAAAALATRRAWEGAALPALALAPLALAAVLALQGALGRVPYGGQALAAALYLAWAALLIVLGAALARALGREALARTLAAFVLAGGALSAGIGLVQHYRWSTPLDFLIAAKVGPAVYGNLAQPNHYAAYLTAALASAAYLFALGRLRAAAAGGLSALLLFSLALSGSRSPWLYLAALGALALGARRLVRDPGARPLARFTLALLPGFLAAQWLAALPLLAPPGEPAVTSAQRLFELASGLAARIELAREGWAMFLSAPLLGAGWGQFAWHHFLEQARAGPGAAPGVFNHAHNLFLQLLAETGLAGTLPVLGALLGWLRGLGRAEPTLSLWWALAVLAVLGLHSLFEQPLWYAYFLGMGALLAGAAAQGGISLRGAAAPRVAAVATLAVGALHLGAVLPAYRGFERLVFAPGGGPARALEERAFARAIARVHREPLLAPYVEVALALGLEPSGEWLREKLELAARAMRFAPGEALAYRYALLLAAADEQAQARAALERAARAYPAGLAETTQELATLARERPDAFAPLLQWALSEAAKLPPRASR